MSDSDKHDLHEVNSGYEKQDVNLKTLILVGLGLAVFIALSLVILSQFFVVEREKTVYEAVLKPPSEQLQKLRAHEDSVLTTTAVLDEEKGIYRIPIERAMELIVEEAKQQRPRRNR